MRQQNQEGLGQYEKKLKICFTKQKFLGLPLKQQHKKCATMLRAMYELLLYKRSICDLQSHYNELQEWMSQPGISSLNPKDISDRYHEHLKAAELSLREHNLLPNITTTDRNHSEALWPIAIYLDNLRSAYNVGSILRTVEGLAMGTVYFSGRTPYIDHKQVQDSSMGAYQWIPCEKRHFTEGLPRPLIVLETSPDAIPLSNFVFPEKFTLAVGNEEYGCSDELLAQADHIITIPMRGKKNSLNVANAFSMAAHEIAKQRTMLEAYETQ